MINPSIPIGLFLFNIDGGGDYVKMFDVEIEECDVIHVLSPTFQGLLVKKN